MHISLNVCCLVETINSCLLNNCCVLEFGQDALRRCHGSANPVNKLNKQQENRPLGNSHSILNRIQLCIHKYMCRKKCEKETGCIVVMYHIAFLELKGNLHIVIIFQVRKMKPRKFKWLVAINNKHFIGYLPSEKLGLRYIKN